MLHGRFGRRDIPEANGSAEEGCQIGVVDTFGVMPRRGRLVGLFEVQGLEELTEYRWSLGEPEQRRVGGDILGRYGGMSWIAVSEMHIEGRGKRTSVHVIYP